MHYLLRDDESRARFGPSINEYTRQIEAGASVSEASEAAFGLTASRLDREVKQHLTRGEFRPAGIPKNSLVYSRKTRTRVLGEAEAAQVLGELAYAVNEPDTAHLLFERSLALDPELARSHAGLGDLAAAYGHWDDAERHFERAVALDPKDALNHLDFGAYWAARADAQEDPGTGHEMRRLARRRLVAASKLDPGIPETYAVYGATFLADGEDASKGLETLEHAAGLLPANLQIRLWLGEAYAQLDRDDEARALLRTVVAWGTESDIALRAQELLAELDAEASPAEVD
jgi:tetratricopeptide (TPR) repeat protein